MLPTMPEVDLRLPPAGARVLVDLGPDLAAAVERSGGWYERHLMALLPHLLPRDGVAVDVGANAGAVCLAMSRLASAGRVIAFEAAPANADRLAANLARTSAANVTLERLAVYDHATELHLDFVDEESGGASVTDRGGSVGVTVPAVALDDYVRTGDLSRVDLVKIDVEGSEVRVLRGARELIERYRPALLVECNPVALRHHDGQPLDALLAELDRYGYQLGWVAGRGAVIPLPDRERLEMALAAAGILDMVAVPDSLPTARGAHALAGRLRARQRLRAANPRGRAPRDRFVTAGQLHLRVDGPLDTVHAGERLAVDIDVTNDGPGWVSSDFRTYPVFVTHHWEDSVGEPVGDQPRTRLASALAPGRVCRLTLNVTAPAVAGRWTLVVRAVQEHFVWFDTLDPDHPLRLPVTVTERAAERDRL